MVYSRADDEKAFKHVLKNILDLEDDHPLTLALDACGYRDIPSILEMDQEDIDNLKYTTKDDEVVQIGVGVMSPHKFPLRNLKRYHLYRNFQGDAIQDWTSVTVEERVQSFPALRKEVCESERMDFGTTFENPTALRSHCRAQEQQEV
jgi:hypothetical protein